MEEIPLQFHRNFSKISLDCHKISGDFCYNRKIPKLHFENMEVKSDDDMGFEKVDDEMGCNSDEDKEYVKVERLDVYMSDDDKSNADVVHEEDVNDEMEYEKNGRYPFPKRIQGMDLQEVDLSYKQYSSDTDMEEENESSDDDFGYGEYMYAYVESKQRKARADVKHEITNEENEKTIQDDIVLTRPFPKRRQDMNLQEIVKDNVLPFLPAKSLVRFRSVSKEWDRWIRTPLLAHQQSYCCKDFSGYFCQYDMGYPTFVSLDNTAYGVPCSSLSFFPEPVNIISSSNGLILCHGCDLDQYYVCNPATQERACLPPPELYHGDNPPAVLAFEPSAMNCGGHYQLLCAVRVYDHILFELYSSVTSSWKVSDTELVEMGGTEIIGNGFYMNGVAYMETSTREVIAFHLATEVHEIIPLPCGAPQNGVFSQAQGELCYIGLSHVTMNEYSVMIYAGFGLGLRCQVDVKIEPGQVGLTQYKVLPCPDERRVMILVGNVVYSFNLVDQCVQKVTTINETHYSLAPAKKYLPYVNSLVHVAKPSAG